MEKVLGNLKKGLVFVISAPAGTGKTTLARMLVDEFPCIRESVSCTTRPPRRGENPDVDYHFLKKQEFEQKIQEGAFLEHAQVFGQYYGTLKEHVDQRLKKGLHVILVIDTQGAALLRKQDYPATFIFIQPPNLAELRTRLFNRKTEHTEHIEERLEFAEHELEQSREYDYIITNDNIHRAYDILRGILIAEEHKTERYHGRNIDQ